MKRLAVTLTILLFGSPARSAYLDVGPASDASPVPRAIIEPRPRRIPPPHPINDVTQFLDKLRVGRSYAYRGLTLFPVELIEEEDDTRYATFAEALDRGWLELRDSGRVNEVIARNRGSRYLFLMGGELLFGGRQNRMLREDIMLWPDSDPVAVPVYCVQKGRWQGRTDFDRAAGLSALSLRRRAQTGASQDTVWEDVRSLAERFSAESPTEDYGAVIQSRDAEEHLKAFHGYFRRRFPRRTVGLVAARGGRLLGADIFCNRRLFEALRDEVIDSYALEVIRTGRPPTRGRLNENAARLFLARIARSRFQWAPSPGAGRSLVFEGADVRGRALVFRRAVIHLEATEGFQITPMHRLRVPPER